MPEHFSADSRRVDHEELAAIARMIAFTRRNARELQLEALVYCLDVALAAALEAMEITDLDKKDLAADIDAHPEPHFH